MIGHAIFLHSLCKVKKKATGMACMIKLCEVCGSRINNCVVHDLTLTTWQRGGVVTSWIMYHLKLCLKCCKSQASYVTEFGTREVGCRQIHNVLGSWCWTGYSCTAPLARHGIDVVASIGRSTLTSLCLGHTPRYHIWIWGIRREREISISYLSLCSSYALWTRVFPLVRSPPSPTSICLLQYKILVSRHKHNEIHYTRHKWHHF